MEMLNNYCLENLNCAHPKCMLDGSTKFHACHVPPSPPPPPPKWKFHFRTGLRKFEVDFWKLVSANPHHSPTLPPTLPPSPPSQNGNFSSGLDLGNLKLTFGNWFRPNPPTPTHPLTLDMGILDFSKFELSIKSWKLVPPPPPPPPSIWEFWMLANLNSASKVGNQFPPPPPLDMGIWDFGESFRR